MFFRVFKCALTCSPWGSGDCEVGVCTHVCAAVDVVVVVAVAAAAQVALCTLPCSCPQAAGVWAHA